MKRRINDFRFFANTFPIVRIMKNPQCVLFYTQYQYSVKACFKLIFNLLFILFFSSCKKENIANKLAGKWQIQQVYNGYINGGDFKWSTIRDEYKSSLNLNSDGTFIEDLLNNWSPYQCSG